MDTSMTVEVIRDAAEVFTRKAADLRRMANELSRTGDWSIVGEAISTCANLSNIRMDLLSIRPVRELERALNKANVEHSGKESRREDGWYENAT